ncbi:response regulator transcription factor [Enterococcus canintestini]|uniref:response regulator transcription factor n=1 Tax=Enterococcus canintestini TaxID=317010 RepID=UPI00288CE12A|nr:response regulator transcription factor [Enterococcus canintestini]MDT2740613.1 response regulator transcription factor [Enterococcus canintestini]
MKRILIVEDDEAIAEIEKDFLIINGFEVTIISNGNEGLEAILHGEYDLILLDVMLPEIDGIAIIKIVRNKINVPIMLVTAKGEEIDKLRGLGLGADDYIVKPFSPTELVARVKANIAQYERLVGTLGGIIARKVEISDIVIEPSTMRVHVRGKEVTLKNKEFELLLFLMENVEHVFNKEELYERIWGMDAFGDNRTVAVHINRLREKIEIDPSSPRHIQTVWGVGYKFVA